jgi:hypothetical protein
LLNHQLSLWLTSFLGFRWAQPYIAGVPCLWRLCKTPAESARFASFGGAAHQLPSAPVPLRKAKATLARLLV